MVVTGDRDAYQLVDDGVRIMTTSRGITDTKVYDREGVIERYGIPPELIPDFIGLKGDTSDNIPGVPGIGDKTASDLLQRFGDLETVLASVDQISGAKRKENLTNHADDARALQAARDDASSTSRSTSTSRPRSPAAPDRARPARRSSASGSCATRCAASRRRSTSAETEAIPRPEAADAKTVPIRAAAARSDIDMLGGDPLALVALAPEIAEGELIPREPHWRFGAYAGGSHALAGEIDDPAELVAAARRPPRRRPRRQGARRRPAEPRLRHRGRRLPARPRPPRLPARRAGRGARDGRQRRATSRPPAPCSSTRSPSARPRRSTSAASSTC